MQKRLRRGARIHGRTVSSKKSLDDADNHKWINKMWYVLTRKCSLAKKKKKYEGLIHATAWMNLENLMLSERRQSHII